MRGYTVAVSAFTLNVPVKWLDNVLTHHDLPGVQQSRQGVRRLLSPDALLLLDIALILQRTLGSQLGTSIELAQKLKAGNGELTSGSPPLHFALDLTRLEADLSRRLAEAVEIAPTPPRGRPPNRSRARS